MDLAGLDGQVDVVVGDEVTEPLGDAAQLESHRGLRGVGGADAAAARPRSDVRDRAAAGGGARYFFGELADVTGTVPAMMSCLSLSTSALRPASTLPSNWLNGASETPLFCSVPR